MLWTLIGKPAANHRRACCDSRKGHIQLVPLTQCGRPGDHQLSVSDLIVSEDSDLLVREAPATVVDVEMRLALQMRQYRGRLCSYGHRRNHWEVFGKALATAFEVSSSFPAGSPVL